MEVGAKYISKYESTIKRGVHAHYINATRTTVTIAIADSRSKPGKGLDRGRFAEMLMQNISLAASEARNVTKITVPFESRPVRPRFRGFWRLPREDSDDEEEEQKSLSTYDPKFEIDPKEILRTAYFDTKGLIGSSTACIITVSGKILRAASVGDSGFLVIRNEKIWYRSPIQQSTLDNLHRLTMNNYLHADKPIIVEDIQMLVEYGDLIIAGSHSILSNLPDLELEKTACEYKKVPLKAKSMALVIAGIAQQNFLRQTPPETPCSNPPRSLGNKHMDGKFEDITVAVAIIQPHIPRRNFS